MVLNTIASTAIYLIRMKSMRSAVGIFIDVNYWSDSYVLSGVSLIYFWKGLGLFMLESGVSLSSFFIGVKTYINELGGIALV